MTAVPRSTVCHPVNGLVRPYPAERTTLDLIEARVARHPAAVAVGYGDTELTYAELDRRANQLAATFLDRGARPDRLLPLLVTDGLELPLSILAAMKANVPFVPMDPRWPADRIGALLATLRTDLLVAGPRTDPVAASLGTPVEVDAGALTGSPARPDVARPDRTDLFYGFFTSGTTGLPKCTLNHHRGLVNRFTTMSRLFGEGHVALQNSKSVFDSSLWQLLWPLTSGGRVVMPVRAGLLDLEQTVRQIGANQVTITDFVPSIFSVLADLVRADAELAACAASLRRILLGGEAINPAAVRRFHEVLPHVEFTNTYGPTEASIGSVFHSFAEPPPDGVEIPIGRPIDNTSAIVVDSAMRPLPPGETGELLIGGDCIGYGYLADPERTARAFLDNPYPGLHGDRLYRTGDLAQFRDDGYLYFVGRIDDQLKLRGVRIEPVEIEDALTRLPGITEAKVFVDGEHDRAQLIAAVIADRPVGTDLLDGARTVLPPELVPDRFVQLDRFPLSANGKTDRRALAETVRRTRPPAIDRAAAEGTRGRIERLWADLLPAIGDPDDSFFDLGGTSLSAQRLALALRAEFGRPVTVHDIADHPTLHAQAALLDRTGDEPWAATEQLLADQHLDPWTEHRTGSPARPEHVLLTGATGFIGCHLLGALLAAGAVTVTCLVRADSAAEAERVLRARLSYYRLPDVTGDPRVRVVVGDLGSPRLGLAEPAHAALAAEVDAIVHAGAQINLVTPYSQLRAANVLGVRELIGLARAGRRKALHHLSTLSVLPGGTAADEDTCLVESVLPADGYSRSKWCAERLLGTAREQGLAVSVYRLGEVMPHRQHRVESYTGSLTELLLDGCRELGLVTRTGAAGDFTPVDAVAELIARAVTDPSDRRPAGDCYHVVGAEHLRLDALLDRLAAECGLATAGYAEFYQRVQAESLLPTASEAIGKLAVMLPEQPADEQAPLAGLFFTSTAAGYRDRFAGRCAELGLAWPEVDEATLTAWCTGPTTAAEG
ncbi:MAG TPA: amino acid adenylation domain-containing protein [Jatrophihabitans sp.]|nr:amino acid adenylation domain-containing protein [Jatrophihabitans sp.]